jgi:VRR-NUC domain.
MNKRPEKETTPEIIKWLQDRGCMAWRMNSGKYRMGGRHIKGGDRGTPDIAFILPDGKAGFVENKSNGSVLSDDQTAGINRAIRQKAHVIVAFNGLEDVVNYFEAVISKTRLGL